MPHQRHSNKLYIFEFTSPIFFILLDFPLSFACSVCSTQGGYNVLYVTLPVNQDRPLQKASNVFAYDHKLKMR